MQSINNRLYIFIAQIEIGEHEEDEDEKNFTLLFFVYIYRS